MCRNISLLTVITVQQALAIVNRFLSGGRIIQQENLEAMQRWAFVNRRILNKGAYYQEVDLPYLAV
jgi:hypothetical protein